MNGEGLSYWAVIPAAGNGARMNSALPKQYLSLHGRTVVEWAFTPFLADPRCRGVMVVIAAHDDHWNRTALQHPKLHITHGGMQRADSVLAGLQALQTAVSAHSDDWVLVHDAARPCLHIDDINALLAAGASEVTGALLATPLSDTLKQADDQQRVTQTVSRTGLWRALTPQMFRLDVLQSALQGAMQRGIAVTDEASAIEAAGLPVRLVAGRNDNIKITLPEDLNIAASILAARN